MLTTESGRLAEAEALRFLKRRGLRPVCRNFRSRFGEIDLVMVDQEVLVFVEVRHRGDSRFTSAAETVDVHKQRRIIATARWFLATRQGFADCTCRFDVLGLDRKGATGWMIDWRRDAFRID